MTPSYLLLVVVLTRPHSRQVSTILPREQNQLHTNVPCSTNRWRLFVTTWPISKVSFCRKHNICNTQMIIWMSIFQKLSATCFTRPSFKHPKHPVVPEDLFVTSKWGVGKVRVVSIRAGWGQWRSQEDVLEEGTTLGKAWSSVEVWLLYTWFAQSGWDIHLPPSPSLFILSRPCSPNTCDNVTMGDLTERGGYMWACWGVSISQGKLIHFSRGRGIFPQ